MATFKCTAVGDCMVSRKTNEQFTGFNTLTDFINKGDFRYFNLETTVHNFEVPGAARSGGSWFCCEPEVLQSMHKYGFNILTNANNHSGDYGIDGLRLTVENIKKAGFPFSGTGLNMYEASKPAYLETAEHRYALISCTTTFHEEDVAGEQTRSYMGRPGVNAVGITTEYHVSEEDIETIRRIAEKTAINGEREIARREGYRAPLADGNAELLDLVFKASDSPKMCRKVKENDLKRLTEAIREAQFFADYVIVSVHSHQLEGYNKETPASFFVELCHKLIDAGADAIIGTGPHLLRPIEIYNGKPIFYSLGDFILQNETVLNIPSDMFAKQGMTGNEPMRDLYEKRSSFGKKGLYYQQVMFESVIPYWEVKDGKLTELTLMPVELGFGEHHAIGGTPKPEFNKGIIERLAKMSEEYGTKITIDRLGYGHVEL